MPYQHHDADVIVIGSGHNALVSAAYLAQCGLRVTVFEKRGVVGGAVSTVEQVPGYQFDLGGSAHILIRLTPIVEELGLDRFGLRYLELDPLFFSPFLDGSSFYVYRDIERSCQELEQFVGGSGDEYRRFVRYWQPFAEAVRDSFLREPGPLQLGTTFRNAGGSQGREWKDMLHAISRPYGAVVDEYFTDERVKSALVWMAAQSGPPPTEPWTAPFLLWHPLYHTGGIARPEGGSGRLTQALRRHIEAHGGTVMTDSPVDEILVESGRTVGVRVGSDIVLARSVLAGTHVLESVGRLLPQEYRPPAVNRVRVGNGFGAVLRLALDRPLRYAADPSPDARIGLQLLCESRQQLLDAYGDFLAGRPASEPPIVAMSFSAVDPSLAPPGGEVLWLWAQYFPYDLAGPGWDEIEGEVADRILDRFERYAPGTRASVVGQLFQHPLWLERELGLLRGNVMHLEMGLDQMFMLRPWLDASRYRGPVPGLYLTGASTHPGGGIMGASGRSAARAVLQDLRA